MLLWSLKKIIMSDWFENLSKEEKQEIEIGLKQADNKEFVDHEEVMKIFEKYKQKSDRVSNLEP
jgi:predicted transcriptional regulator